MRRILILAIAAMGLLAITGGEGWAASLLAPGDFIIAIDTDPPTSNSSSPAGEPPADAIDGLVDKYLNFGGAGSGIIVTPGGSTTVQSFRLTTANDAEGRDPASFQLFGTNDPITSANHSGGLAENWTFIDGFNLSGPLALPAARNTLGPVTPITNGTAYASYKMIYPAVKSTGSIFQIGEVSFYESNDATGTDILDAGDPILGIQFGPASRFPGAEGPPNAIDLNLATKYLNFGKANSGFIVTPASGSDVVRTFQISTANDSPSRDPSSWELWGTDDAITELQHGQGNADNWTLIDSGSVELPLDRLTPGPYVIVDNNTAYASYKMIFPTQRDANAGDADSMQYSEVQFYNVQIPEPSTIALAAFALLGCFGARYRRAD